MSQRDLARLCTNLQSAGVEVKPDEVGSPTRAIVLRAVTDFASISMMACPESLNQPLACNLENHNPSSAVSCYTTNRLILSREALRLLSKGSTQFNLMDIFKPDHKKFCQMLQQMLKYFYHSEGVYDLVNDACAALDETAARVERQREDLDFERNELNVISQRVQALTEARVHETLAEVIVKKEAVGVECNAASSDYNELKHQVERAAAELAKMTQEIEPREARLADLRAMVVEDPDSYVQELQNLKEEISLSKEQVASKERAVREASDDLHRLNEALERSKALRKLACEAVSAHDELTQMEKQCEQRVTTQRRLLVELESEHGELKASVDARTRQLQKVEEEHREALEALQALEETEMQRREMRVRAEAQKRPVMAEISNVTSQIQNVEQDTASKEDLVRRRLTEEYSDLMKLWNGHVEEAQEFNKVCQLTEAELEARRAELSALCKAIDQIGALNNQEGAQEKR